MLEATIEVSYFLKLVDALKEIVREVHLKFSKKGMTIQCMDPAQIAFVTLFLEKNGFDEYKCQKPTTLGIDLEAFGTVLRLSRSPSDKLTLIVEDFIRHGTSAQSQSAQAPPSTINIVLKDEKTGRITEFAMKLVNFEESDFKVPKSKSDSLLCMRSADFSHICRDLGNISDSVEIGYVKRGINLSVTSDIANGSISICDNDTMPEEEEKKDLTNKKLLTDVETGAKNVIQFLSQLSIDSKEKQEFSLKYINIFNKGATFSPTIKIHLAAASKEEDREPMIMEFKIGEIGEIKYYLAPKITE